MVTMPQSTMLVTAEESRTLLRVLSDETRQEIMILIAHNTELSSSAIASRFSLSRPAISHHVNLMKRAGVLRARKEGREIYYSLDKKKVITMLQSTITMIHHA